MKISTVIQLILLIKYSSCEKFSSSIDSLYDLASNFHKIVQDVENLTKNVKSEYVNRKLQEFKDEEKFIHENIKKYVTNPLNAFKLIKLTTYDVENLRSNFPDEFDTRHFNTTLINRPSHEDLSGAVEGILRLQEVYWFQSKDFANGVINGIQTREPLTPHDLLVIAKISLKLHQKDYFVRKYLKLAKSKFKKLKTDTLEMNENEIRLNLASSLNRTGNYRQAIKLTKKILKSSPNLTEALKIQEDSRYLKKIKYQPKRVRRPFSDKFTRTGALTERKEQIVFSQVCRGKLQKSFSDQSKLFCRFLSKSAYTKLVKSKIEELNLEPYIILYHDVVSDREGEVLRKLAKPKKIRSETDEDDEIFSISNVRVSQISWLDDKNHTIVEKISKRISAMTGLSLAHAEPLQLQNYGIGGHYDLHWDYSNNNYEEDDLSENRIATFLIYLTDVESGGYTAFPFHKVRVPVLKNAAAFWHNLRPGGDGDSTTRHASCPVIIGEKWVANKWIINEDQTFIRLCPPQQMYKEDWDLIYDTIY